MENFGKFTEIYNRIKRFLVPVGQTLKNHPWGREVHLLNGIAHCRFLGKCGLLSHIQSASP